MKEVQRAPLVSTLKHYHVYKKQDHVSPAQIILRPQTLGWADSSREFLAFGSDVQYSLCPLLLSRSRVILTTSSHKEKVKHPKNLEPRSFQGSSVTQMERLLRNTQG